MTTKTSFENWISTLPKAELHLHLDGSLQAERLLALAEKNKILLPYNTIEEVEAAYNFDNLQSFLDLYYLGASVLRDEEDFYHLMMDYLLKCRQQNIAHTEIMVEPQTYFPNGVSINTMFSGFTQAITDAKSNWDQSVLLILSFLRHLSEEEAIDTLEKAEPFREHLTAIGLASSEIGNPPNKFTHLYQLAFERGYKTVAHAGEEGPPSFIWDSLNLLKVQRIDHGIRCQQDQELVDYLRRESIPLTVCPLSNIKLRVFEKMEQHNILQLLEDGLVVTVNSDDPAYFGGYLNENFTALHEHLALTNLQTVKLIENSFTASFLPDVDKLDYIQQLHSYL